MASPRLPPCVAGAPGLLSWPRISPPRWRSPLFVPVLPPLLSVGVPYFWTPFGVRIRVRTLCELFSNTSVRDGPMLRPRLQITLLLLVLLLIVATDEFADDRPLVAAHAMD